MTAENQGTTVRPPPRRLSDLIEMAVEHARSLDRDAYRPNAREWHRAEPHTGTCMVCLSGAMIAGAIGEDPMRDAEPSDYHREWKWTKALYALDETRRGDYGHALIFLGMTPPVPPGDFRWRYPQPDAQEFQTWEEFDVHLASLEEAALALRADGY